MEQVTEFPFYCSSPSGVWHYALINKKLCIAICAEPGLESISNVQIETALTGGFVKVEKAIVARMFLQAQKRLWEKVCLEGVNLFDPYEANDLRNDLAKKYNIPVENVEIIKEIGEGC